MVTSRRYAEELRTIGQALEVKGVTAFELHCVKAGYFIRDLREPGRSLRHWLRRQFTNTETHGFEPNKIEELSRAGRARRTVPGQVTNFRDLSNVLRTIGSYVDSKDVQLIELQKTPMSISLFYRDRSGNEVREDRPVSSFYDLFREVFSTRSTKTTPPTS